MGVDEGVDVDLSPVIEQQLPHSEQHCRAENHFGEIDRGRRAKFSDADASFNDLAQPVDEGLYEFLIVSLDQIRKAAALGNQEAQRLTRGPVLRASLVQEADERAQARVVGARQRRDELVQFRKHRPRHVADHLVEHPLFVLEIKIDRAFGDAGELRHVLEPRCGIAVPGEFREGGVEDLGGSFRLPARPKLSRSVHCSLSCGCPPTAIAPTHCFIYLFLLLTYELVNNRLCRPVRVRWVAMERLVEPKCPPFSRKLRHDLPLPNRSSLCLGAWPAVPSGVGGPGGRSAGARGLRQPKCLHACLHLQAADPGPHRDRPARKSSDLGDADRRRAGAGARRPVVPCEWSGDRAVGGCRRARQRRRCAGAD